MEKLSWNDHISHWKEFLQARLNDFSPEDADYWRIHRQLKAVEQIRYAAVANPKLVTEFINPRNLQEVSEDLSDLTFTLELNESQKQAVAQALADTELCLIQGPPGTGKTQVIAEICLQLYKRNPGIKILVCSETHTAVNTLLIRIDECEQNLRIVRLRDRENNLKIQKFNPQAIAKGYLEWLKSYCTNDDAYDIIATSMADPLNRDFEKALALSAHIAGMTCNRVGAYQFDGQSEAFDVVIIDEVCKATLPEILIPLSVGKRAILVGDPKQLPPVFCSEERELIKLIDRLDLDRYMYIDQLFLKKQYVSVLNTQYRMENSIGNLISELFYDGMIQNGFDRTIEHSISWIDYTPCHSWPVPIEDPNGKPDLRNEDERSIIIEILSTVDSAAKKPLQVAVITPYRSQKAEIQGFADKTTYQNLDVNVDTVDGFQGKECDIVIFSVTRTVGTPVFIADKQRLNVALSRARNRVIIVGNSRYALQSEILKKVWEKSYSIFYETIESVKPALQ